MKNTDLHHYKILKSVAQFFLLQLIMESMYTVAWINLFIDLTLGSARD